jgi:hypothetical protein
MKRVTMLVMCAVVLLAGCSYVTPGDRLVIHDNALNASAIAAKAEVDANLPDYARRWFAAEAKTWRAMDAWAKGEPFVKATE